MSKRDDTGKRRLRWFPFNITDWRAGTRGMTLAQRGLYLEMLLEHYERPEGIPSDHRALARIANCTTKEVAANIEAVRCKWTALASDTRQQVEGDANALLVHARVLFEHDVRAQIAAKRAEAAAYRWANNKGAQVSGPRVPTKNIAQVVDSTSGHANALPVHDESTRHRIEGDAFAMQMECKTMLSTDTDTDTVNEKNEIALSMHEKHSTLKKKTSPKKKTTTPALARGAADEPEAQPKQEGKGMGNGSTRRGTTLTIDALPQAWKEWSLTEGGMTARQAAREFAKFHDYWIAVPGAKGTKLDWFATWRNWCRRTMDDAARKRSDGPTPSAASMLGTIKE